MADLDALAAKYGIGAAPSASPSPASGSSDADALASKYGVSSPAPKKRSRVIDPRFVDDEPAPSRTFTNTGPDAAGQLRSLAADIGGTDKGAPSGLGGLIAGQTQSEIPSGRAAQLGFEQGASLGLGPTIKAGAETVAAHVPGLRQIASALQPADLPPIDPNVTYEQRRKFYSGELANAREQHPVVTGLGELVGGVIPGTLVAGAGPVAALAPTARAAVTGMALGGANAAGESVSRGDNASKVIQDAETGAALGGVIGPAAEYAGAKIVKVIDHAKDRYIDDFAKAVVGRSLPKDKVAFTRLLDRKPEPGVVETAREYMASPELAPVKAAANKGDLETAGKMLEGKLGELNADKIPDYRLVDQHSHGFHVGKAIDQLENDSFREAAKNPRVAAALTHARDNMEEQFASVPTKVVASMLNGSGPEGQALAATLPTKPQITRSELTSLWDDAGASTNLRRAIEPLYDPQNGIAKLDPKATIPTLAYRRTVTAAQNKAVTAMGTLNATQNAEIEQAISKSANQALESHLDEAAAKAPEVADAVNAIRNRDVKISLLATLRKGIDQRESKELVSGMSLGQRVGNLATHGTAHVISGMEIYHALPHLAAGDFGGAASKLATAAAVEAAPRVAAAANRGVTNSLTNGTLSKIVAAARNGNPTALELLRGLKQSGVDLTAAGGADLIGEQGPQPQEAPNGLVDDTRLSGSNPGMVEPGNIDLTKRPKHVNPDGSISTVRSASFNIDGKEVLLPTVADDGRLLTDDQAVDLYRRTGRHLGKFDNPDAADAYAQRLHEQQAGMYVGR